MPRIRYKQSLHFTWIHRHYPPRVLSKICQNFSFIFGITANKSTNHRDPDSQNHNLCVCGNKVGNFKKATKTEDGRKKEERKATLGQQN